MGDEALGVHHAADLVAAVTPAGGGDDAVGEAEGADVVAELRPAEAELVVVEGAGDHAAGVHEHHLTRVHAALAEVELAALGMPAADEVEGHLGGAAAVTLDLGGEVPIAGGPDKEAIELLEVARPRLVKLLLSLLEVVQGNRAVLADVAGVDDEHFA